MECLSCHRKCASTELRFFLSKIPLCVPCHTLAESAERQVSQAIWRAQHTARELLLEHILQGKLLAGGAGTGDIEIKVEGRRAEDPQG